MRNRKTMLDERGKIPLALILIFVLLVGGAVFAFLAYSGIIVVPGITPEEEEEAPPMRVEITPEQQLESKMREFARAKLEDERKIGDLEEKIELKDERIQTLIAENERLKGLIRLTDESSKRDVAAVFESMDPENAVAILGNYEPEKTVLILKAMEEKDAAAILEGMDPDIAAQITQIMAGFINPFPTQEESTPAAPPTQPPPATGPTASGGG